MSSFKYRDGIVNNDSNIFEEIISIQLTKTIFFVKKNSGSIEDGEDVFYEGLTELSEQILEEPNLPIPDKTFFGYLYRIIYNKWMDALKKRGRLPIKGSDDLPQVSDEDYNKLQKMIRDDEYKYVLQVFEELGENCKQVITDFFIDGVKDKEIAVRMEKSVNYIRIMRFRCLNKFRGLFSANS